MKKNDNIKKLFIEQTREKILTDLDFLKYEIAEELGLMDKIKKEGWKSLSSKETGKIGGLMTKHIRQKTKKEESN